MRRDAPVDGATSRRPATGTEERHLALAAVAQQISQIVATLSMLAAITLLARRLSLPAFGMYGLLVSLTSYVLFVQTSVETAAVKAIAEAVDQAARDRAFSAAISLYTLGGLVGGVVIATGGSASLGLFDIPAGLRDEAQSSVLALAAVTALGWPFKIFHDVLRGSQLFVAAAVAEAVAFLSVGAALVGLALGDATLWLLVGVGAGAPFAIGVVSGVIVLLMRLPYRFSKKAITTESAGQLLGLSTYLALSGLADLVVYSLDRAILATFRSAATVGLYEGPVRAHTLVQQFHSSLATPVVAASAQYMAQHDVHRTRELLLRGTRYTLAAVVPVTIVLMVLAGPILQVWLGTKFRAAETAMIVLVGYWLLNGNTGVPSRMLVAAGRVRIVTLYAAAVAAANLMISLALTPSLGMDGVVLGTTISFALGFPFFVGIVLATFPVRLGEFAREVWLPAYTTGALVAAALLTVRLSVTLDSLGEIGAAAVGATLLYWGAYYMAWLRPNERKLVKSVARAAIRR